MRVDLQWGVVYRDNGPRIYKESTFWRHVARALGKKWIAKLMYKDGHLVADTQHYARTRDGEILLSQTDYAIREVYRAYNQDGQVSVLVTR